MESNKLSIAGPWRRLLARHIDFYIAVVLIAIILELIFGRSSVWYLRLKNMPYAHIFTGIIYLPFALIIDALVCNLFGTNIGKYLLGIRVQKIEGKMSLNDWLRRALGVWRSGFAFGIPLLGFWTFSREHQLIKDGKQSTYDAKGGFHVLVQSVSPAKKIMTILSVSAIALLLGYGVWLLKENAKLIDDAAQSAPYNWKNPSTNIETLIESGWKFENSKNEDGISYYKFSDTSEKVMVIFFAEQSPVLINEYISGLVEKFFEKIHFNGGGRYYEINNVPTWEGSGEFKVDPKVRMKLEIRKIGEEYWRIATIQDPPYEFTDTKAKFLAEQLWKTIGINQNGSEIKINL